MSLTLSYDQLPLQSEVADYLDVSVNQAAVAYCNTTFKAGLIVRTTDLLSQRRILQITDTAISQLAYFSDARAKCESLEPAEEDELAWVKTAQAGVARIGRYIGKWRMMHQNGLFITDKADLQRETYNDMRAEPYYRVAPKGLSGVEYGRRVAFLETIAADFGGFSSN
jgi:hypothetical protein